jgi:hypothetical protein
MQKDYKTIWEEFNHNGQPHYGIAMLALKQGNMNKALEYFAKFEAVWDLALASFQPVDQYNRTDDDFQPTLYLKTKEGTIYVGVWCPHSGYFFADELVSGNHPAGNELPGRMYNQPVAFAYKI